MSEISDTPRTDKAISGPMAQFNESQKLERELNEANAKLRVNPFTRIQELEAQLRMATRLMDYTRQDKNCRSPLEKCNCGLAELLNQTLSAMAKEKGPQ